MVLEHLDRAIEELQEARSYGGLGTSMRIDSLIADVKQVREDTEEIQDD